MNRILMPSRVRVLLLGHENLADERPAAHEHEQNAWRLRQYYLRLRRFVVLRHGAGGDADACELAIAKRHERGERRLELLRQHWTRRKVAGPARAVEVMRLRPRGLRGVQ